MTDDERSEVEIQRHQDRALLLHRQKNPVNPGAASALNCEECGNVIPDDRRKALPGVKLCVACKQAEELKERNGQ